MPLENGIQTPGTLGRATHLGEPLSCEQIRQLPDRAEVVITWCGGNGPHPYRILVDTDGERRVENGDCDRLLPMDGLPSLDGELQKIPFHRITLGWDDTTREWAAQKAPDPDHMLERQEILRGIPQPQWTPLQMRVATALEDAGHRLTYTQWTKTTPTGPLVVERELLFAAVAKTARAALDTMNWVDVLRMMEGDELPPDDRMVMGALLDLDERLASLPYKTPGGLPVVERDLIFKPVDEAAAKALGEHWRRALRRARAARPA